MKWGGFNPFTLSDFPGCVAAVAFSQGCNFNCAYCHNRSLIKKTIAGGDKSSGVSDNTIIAHLQRRRGQLNGLVITGGEPTCQPDLPAFAQLVRDTGMKIKLDTNGSHPDMLLELLVHHLVDYVAMDIKAPWHKYQAVAGAKADADAIKRSIEILTQCSIPYEFRVTAVSPLLDAKDLLEIGAEIGAIGPVYLQKFQSPHFSLFQTMDTTPGLLQVSHALQQQFESVYVR
ncbi:MAG: anaerobic ribonucleoside-triphosphate reductase activating protein [Deltaproteobacteria bacterium]|nr:anaerobic ribonucleoside-triphosphate reductase activating protein [Deltaproteobacteria bacterium]